MKSKGNVEQNHIHQETAGPGHNSRPPPHNKHTLFRINIINKIKNKKLLLFIIIFLNQNKIQNLS